MSLNIILIMKSLSDFSDPNHNANPTNPAELFCFFLIFLNLKMAYFIARCEV